MVTTKEKGLLEYIVSYCDRVQELIAGVTKEDFDNSKNLRELVCFNLFQIGELVTIFTDEFIEKHNKVPWRNIRGMRNIIVHRYGTINMVRVWQTATEDIQPLKDYCEEIIRQELNS